MRTLVWVVVLVLIVGCASEPPQFSPGSMDMTNVMDPRDSSTTGDQSSRYVIATMTDDAHRRLTGGAPIGRDMANPDYPLPVGYQRFIAELGRSYGVTRVADWPLQSLGVRCFVFRLGDGVERDRVIDGLRSDVRIESVQPMQTFSVLANRYDDPYLPLQHSFETMRIGGAHRWSTGKGVKVAVVDTGIDVDHEDLRTKIAMRRNFVDDDEHAYRADDHGTAVAGLIVAEPGNRVGIAGIAPGARIMAFKGCWRRSAGPASGAVCSSFTLAKAIDMATVAGAEIINLSLAGPSDPLLERLVRRALAREITIVASIGPGADQVFPHAVPGVIAVAESERTPDGRKIPESVLGAPGQNIVSLSPGDRYDFYSGSSLSTAQVSGLVALIKERKPHLASRKILELIQQNSFQYRATKTGAQAIDACGTVAQLVGGECSD